MAILLKSIAMNWRLSVKVGDLVNDTRRSPEYTPRPGLVMAITGVITGTVARVKYPGSMPVWAPIEALEVISESR